MREAVEKARPNVLFNHMLDLGCGTGLAGMAFRPLVRRLTGIDLSPAMVARARAKQVYDRLDTDDLVQFLAAEQSNGGVYDLVVAADVFVYLFDLAPVATAVAKVLRPDGLFAFTVENPRRRRCRARREAALSPQRGPCPQRPASGGPGCAGAFTGCDTN